MNTNAPSSPAAGNSQPERNVDPAETPPAKIVDSGGPSGAAALLASLERDPVYQQSIKEALAVNEAYQKAVQHQSHT